MIKINLLPENLRKSESVQKIPLLAVIYIISLIIIVLHILLGVLSVYKKVQLTTLDKTWNKIQPQYKEVQTLKKELAIKRDKVKLIDFLLKRNIYLTDFLNKINKAVPKGLWLNRLSFSETGLFIEGSVFSFGTDEVSLVNKFFNELKNDGFFQKNFNNFNLESMQRRNIKEYEVLDFLLTAKVNEDILKIK